MTRFALPALLALTLLSAPARAATGPAGMPEMEMIGTPAIIAPEAPPVAATVLFSGPGGWGDDETALARRLAGTGTLVIGIDLPATLARIEAKAPACATLIGEIEATSHLMQRRLGSQAYHFPVLAGIDAGATMALAVARQTAAATIERVVAVDPAPPAPRSPSLCEQGGPHPFPVEVLHSDGAAPADMLARALARPASSGSEGGDDLAELPLIELPVAQPSPTLAVLYSGDGGWRDLDKDLAAILQKDGLPVVGVDVLRYFWHRQGPDHAARDLGRIIAAYTRRWDATRVVLIGFSFGADVMPILYNRLPATDRARVVQITLLGLSDHADFEVTVSGWLNHAGQDSLPTLSELARIDPRLVQCLQGKDDDDAICSRLAGSGAEVVVTSGGHHFDGDYPALARRILNGLNQRP